MAHTVDDIDEIITVIENQYPENVEYLEDVHFGDFKNEIESGNKYKSGLYIVEHRICVYRVLTKIYYGYLFNDAQKELRLVDQ